MTSIQGGNTFEAIQGIASPQRGMSVSTVSKAFQHDAPWSIHTVSKENQAVSKENQAVSKLFRLYRTVSNMEHRVSVSKGVTPLVVDIQLTSSSN